MLCCCCVLLFAFFFCATSASLFKNLSCLKTVFHVNPIMRNCAFILSNPLTIRQTFIFQSKKTEFYCCILIVDAFFKQHVRKMRMNNFHLL